MDHWKLQTSVLNRLVIGRNFGYLLFMKTKFMILMLLTSDNVEI